MKRALAAMALLLAALMGCSDDSDPPREELPDPRQEATTNEDIVPYFVEVEGTRWLCFVYERGRAGGGLSCSEYHGPAEDTP